jgi:exopolysaccharide production protein ExoQ
LSQLNATLVCIAGIMGLFWLDRDRRCRPSLALWITVIWFALACSRPLGNWLNMEPVSGSPTDQLVEGSPVDRAALTGLLFCGLIVLVSRKERVTKILSGSLPIVLFFAYCLVSLLWSDYPEVGFKRWNKALGDWVMVLIVWTDADPVAALKRLFARIGYVLIPLSLLFIKYYPYLGRTYGRWSGDAYYVGVTAEKNTLGSICLIFGLASLWSILNLLSNESQSQGRNRRMIVHCVILAMIVYLLSIADSMTSLSCFVLGTCVVVAARFRFLARVPLLIHAFCLTMVALPASIALLGASPDALHQMGRNSTLTERTDIWAAVLQLIPNRWIGAGFESFWLGPRLDTIITNVTHWWVPNQSHNGYLEIFANLGWIGIGLLAFVILTGYRGIIHAWRRNQALGSLLLAYFLAGLVYNITEAGFFRMMIPVWLFFLLAITDNPVADALKKRLLKSVRSKILISPSQQPALSYKANV